MKIQKLFLNKALLLIFAVVMSFALAEVSLAAGAREFENPPCYDITGVSTPLNVGGVPNGGTMDFDDAGVSPAYQACVRMTSFLPTATPARLEGWVWNSNLGWVSLYCPGGVGALNLDIACGSIAYSVTIATTGTGPNFTTVKLSGNAWGDNVGYISFNSAWHQTAPISSGASKGLIDTSMGTAAYHAYADAVGWLDLRGVRLYWYDTDPPIPDPNVIKYISVCSSKDPLPPGALVDPKCTCDLDSTCLIPTDPTKIPDANGTDVYDIKIPFVDGGAAITSANIGACPPSGTINMYTLKPGVADYCAMFALSWEDDVDYDQTSNSPIVSQSQASPKFNAVNSGAVQKPLNYSLAGPDFTYDGVNTLWGAKVKSYAPTSDRNIMGGMPNEKFHYSDIASGVYNTGLINQNLLKLKEIRLLFFKYSTGVGLPGSCLYGTINTTNCDIRNYMTTSTTLGFNPLVEVSKLLYKKGDKWINFIDVSSIENQQDFNEKVDIKASAIAPTTLFYIGLETPGVFTMNWVDSFPQTSPPVGGNIKTSLDATENNWIAQIFSAEAGASITTNAGPYVYSKTDYKVSGSPIPIVYFGGKLPRIKAGLLLNPVAKVEGNVYVTDFAQKSADFSLRSLGNIASNLRREAVSRNVAKYVAGYSGGGIATGDRTITATNYKTSGLSELVTDKVFYLKGNLTIDCGPPSATPCTFDKNVTFIVENGNIFVNSDIRSADGKTQVGLIALRNLTGNVQNQGFLYLSKNVGWLQNVQIYLDRLMQGYDPTSMVFDTNGFALHTGDDYVRQTIFNNQLVIEGTISSMNGVGNASRVTPVYESGAAISPAGSYCASYRAAQGAGVPPINGICRARVADINYMRYYGPGLVLCQGAGVEGPTAMANIPQDQALKGVAGSDNGCNLDYPGYDIGANNLYSVDASMDLVPGGGTGARSQYFIIKSLPATLQNEYPVNFFYRPISKDLKGFEVDQDINQITR